MATAFLADNKCRSAKRSRFRPSAVVAGASDPLTTNQSALARAERILSLKIEYVVGPFLDDVLDVPPADERDEYRVLTAEQEVALFRAMNAAKYRANRLRKMLSLREPSEEMMDDIERLLSQACELRNRLVRVFLKLGAALARRYASPEFPWDELSSEANLTLLRAVERFDCQRGCRFSTYATHAVRRNLMRYLTHRRRQRQAIVSLGELDTVDCGRWTWDYERQMADATTRLDDLLERLEPRDQFILRRRFGLAGSCRGQSLQRIADELGVSRERVRQLECRATDRLRAVAREANFSAPVA
jgi:RNA polymerase sigma factor (sigma-70 family)